MIHLKNNNNGNVNIRIKIKINIKMVEPIKKNEVIIMNSYQTENKITNKASVLS